MNHALDVDPQPVPLRAGSCAAGARSSFLPELDRLFLPRLQHRAATMRRVFELLEVKGQSEHLIVETGCARTPGNWAGDGQSTVLFDRFVNCRGGRVLSVDLSPEACAAARSMVSDRTLVTCAESVAFLGGLRPARPVDLLYLDSFDLDWNDPHPSSLHHLLELCAAQPLLGPGALVVVDDDPGGRGKGAYVRRFFQRLGIAPVFDAYQVGWVLPGRDQPWGDRDKTVKGSTP